MSTVEPNTTLPATWVLERLKILSKMVKDLGSSDDSAECILPQIIDNIARLRRMILNLSPGISSVTIGGAIQLRPADLTIDRVISIFKIFIPARFDAAVYEFKLSAKPLEVPALLTAVLTDLNRSNDYSELSARAGVDFLIMKARQALMSDNQLQSIAEPRPLLRIIADLDLSIKVYDLIMLQDTVVAGHADWAVGYGTGDDIACTFLVVQAKNPSSFSGMYLQLLISLAIARERRIQQRMKDVVVHGVVTDGVLYRFMMIEATGRVRQSAIYELFLEGQLQVIYSFLYELLRAAVFCSRDSAAGEDDDEEEMDEREDEDEDEDTEVVEG